MTEYWVTIVPNDRFGYCALVKRYSMYDSRTVVTLCRLDRPTAQGARRAGEREIRAIRKDDARRAIRSNTARRASTYPARLTGKEVTK